MAMADLAHWLLLATVKEAGCFDIWLSTIIGLRLNTSIDVEYSNSMALENESMKAFVAE